MRTREDKTSTVGLYAFDTVDLGNRWQLNGGLRWEYYDATYKAEDAAGVVTTDLSTTDGLFSGKAGLLYQLTSTANVYLSYGSTVTPPGTANFTLSSQPNNQNNPNVDPQKSRNYEIGSKIGFYENKLSLTSAVFRTDNENVIYTVDATAIPPIFNQDDRQRVQGFTIGSLGQITPQWQVLASFGYLEHPADQPEPAEQRQAPGPDAGVLRQLLDDVRISRGVSRSAADFATWMRCS